MPKKKINLEEILLEEMDKFRLSFPDENLYSTEQIKESLELPYFKAAMKEACRQVLELAAENALVVSVPVFMNQILDENGNITGQFPQYGYSVDKQSILNTLDQVG